MRWSKKDEGQKSIVQQILQKSTDFLRRIILPVEGPGRVTLSFVCPHRNGFPLENYIWWVSTRHGESSATRGVQRAAGSVSGGTPTRSWSHRGFVDRAQ